MFSSNIVDGNDAKAEMTTTTIDGNHGNMRWAIVGHMIEYP